MGTKVLLVFATLVVSACGAKQVTIDAALYYEDIFLYMIAGDEIMIIKDDVETDQYMNPNAYLGLPENMKVKAGVMTFASKKALYYGDKFGYFQNYAIYNNKGTKLKYGPKRKFIKNGGPDAAARRDGELIFFKGCQMSIRYKWNKWGKPTDMRDDGLPCHLDAAWKYTDNSTVLLRGDEIWFWHLNSTLEGPTPFNSTYNISSWELLPYEGSDEL